MSYNRISARRNSRVILPSDFTNGGQLADPYAIYRVELYCGKVAPEAMVDVITMPDPGSSSYPSPIEYNATGKYAFIWDVPGDAVAPNVYFDVWYFFGRNPSTDGSVPVLADYEAKLISTCNRFWVYPDEWYADGGLQSIRLGFEALDIKYRKPEIRPLEVGLMPLPLYDYNRNLVDPILPYLKAKINIWTCNNEQIVENAEMTIKLRQGSFRSNPFVLSYLFNTTTLFIGSYKYRVSVELPDGTTRVSQDFALDVL